jgi:hypothetical protein
VQSPEAVGSVVGIQATQGIGAIKGTGIAGKRRSTRIMSAAEREQLFKMINEEADKLFDSSGLSEEKRSVLKEAVKMAVDSGLIDDEKKPKP